MAYSFRPMDEEAARTFLAWRYAPPYDRYNVELAAVEDALPSFLDPSNGYFAIADESDDLVAFCCFGADAQVPGGDYEVDALDVGFGMRPDLTGQGRGSALVAAIVDFAGRRFHPRAFRATVAAFNRRSQRACEKVGFHQVQTFHRTGDGEQFVVLIRQT